MRVSPAAHDGAKAQTNSGTFSEGAGESFIGRPCKHVNMHVVSMKCKAMQ